LDPAVNIYSHRTISFRGNCSAPNTVIFRATKPGTALIWIQDHATGTVACLTMDSESTGTIGIAGRQHIIADYERVIFGAMPDRMHVAMNEFSIASCLDTVWIIGDAKTHFAAANNSNLNLNCSITLSEPRVFTYFVNAVAFSIVDAQHAKLFGSVATGVGCNSWNAIVYLPAQRLPGSEPGTCQAPQTANGYTGSAGDFGEMPKMGRGRPQRKACLNFDPLGRSATLQRARARRRWPVGYRRFHNAPLKTGPARVAGVNRR